MQTQKDHVDADRFQSLRVADAVTFGHAPHLEVRARRAGTGVLVGVVIGVLAVVAVGVYGLIVPGGATSWRQPGAIIMNRDTGARLIYRDGALHAVRNYSSALLAQGKGAETVSTSSSSLSGVPLAGRVGIPGAPDTVPSATGLVMSDWLLCASAVTPGAGAPDAAALTLLVDDAEGAPALAADRFALVSDQAGRRWILFGGERHAVEDQLVPLVLGMQTARPVAVPEVWLRARPLGVPLARPSIPGAGDRGPTIAGRPVAVGSLFTYTAANGLDEGLVALRDGLADVPPMEFALLRAHATSARALTASELGAAPRSGTTVEARLPDLLRDQPVALDSTALCQLQHLDGTTDGPLRAVSVGGPAFLRRSTAVLNVRMDAGQGVYAFATDATGDAVGQARYTAKRYLVIGDGQKYPVLTGAAADALGLAQGAARPVPPALLSLLPTGPGLSRAAVGSRDE